MSSFLVLLPLTLVTAALGALLIFSPQVRDYVDFIASLEGHPDAVRLPVQLAAHILAYLIACFTLVVTTRTIAAPVDRERADVICRIRMALEAIFVAVPSVIIVALTSSTMVRATAGAPASAPPEAMFWVAAGVAAVALAVILLSGWPRTARGFQLALVAVVAGIPPLLLVLLLVQALAGGKSVSWLLALAAAIGSVGLVISVAAVVLIERPLELFRSTLRPLSLTVVDALAALALAVCLALVVVFVRWPVESASFLGMFPVLFLASATALLVVAAIFAKGSAPVAILSIAISATVVMHALDGLLPVRELRYHSEIPAGLKPKTGASLGIREVVDARGIPDLREGFQAWLEARRPAIEMYRNKGRSYPVFVVAAQGGGVYAAYHSALSLARLYDACPELANHTFALSGVSGGSLGSALFAELLRSLPESQRRDPAAAVEGCNPRPGAVKLEDKVKAFFTADLLSPVVDSALVFDIPSLMVPWLRFGLDRAYALEYAFENAWRKAGLAEAQPYGLKAGFYGRWTPNGPAPALFLSATGVNYGVPVMVSQIRWAQNPRLVFRQPGKADSEFSDLLSRMQAQNERTRNSVIANILDFRPDLQLATSTAVGISARFPYVTPPANIVRNTALEKPTGLYENIDVLEMLDGAYFDNSGGSVAIDMLDDLERYLRRQPGLREFADDIRFQLVRFTDRPAQRYGDASEEEHFELLTPLVAFNSVRAARGAQLRGVQDLERTSESFLYLADPWFQPSLNWLLSQDTKLKIELRSGGEDKPENAECCRVIAPVPAALTAREAQVRRTSPREILLVADWEKAKKLNDSPEAAGWKVEQFVPNNAPAFAKLLTLVKEGDERGTTLASR